MVNISGPDEEIIPLCKAVKATGNIEDWLGALEKGMQVTKATRDLKILSLFWH